MRAFEHVVTLLSFVYALALTHVLSRIGTLLVARKRVLFSGLLALATINVIALLYVNWLSLWDLRGAAHWNLAAVTIQFVFAVAVYIACSLIAPETSEPGPIDLEKFYDSQRKPFYWAILAVAAISLVGNAVFLETPNAALFFDENAATLSTVPLIILPLAVPSRWAQWTGGITFLLSTVGFTIFFNWTLG